MKDDTLYVEQILDAIRKIRAYTDNVSLEGFLKNGEKQSAIILQLIIIGELAKKLSADLKSQTNTPWKQIAGLRDRAVHDYYSLALKDVWNTIQNDIPALENALGKVV
ncbi:MAG: DUF86 domain-containing protein [Patescibacteria group bacterium]